MYKKLHQQTRKDAKKSKIFTKFNVDKMLNIKQKQCIMVPFSCIDNIRVGQPKRMQVSVLIFAFFCLYTLIHHNASL